MYVYYIILIDSSVSEINHVDVRNLESKLTQRLREIDQDNRMLRKQLR